MDNQDTNEEVTNVAAVEENAPAQSVSQGPAPSEAGVDAESVAPEAVAPQVDEAQVEAPQAPYIQPYIPPPPPPDGWVQAVWKGGAHVFVYPDYNQAWGGDLVFFANVPRYVPQTLLDQVKYTLYEEQLVAYVPQAQE